MHLVPLDDPWEKDTHYVTIRVVLDEKDIPSDKNNIDGYIWEYLECRLSDDITGYSRIVSTQDFKPVLPDISPPFWLNAKEHRISKELLNELKPKKKTKIKTKKK